MATFDQLSAEQRAIIELVLKQGQSYDGLGETLGLPTSRVRSMAREALSELAPISAAAVDDDWRDQLADYLLNQQTGPEATATRGHLRRSEAARGWARSIQDSLDHLYANGNIPQIPDRDEGSAAGSGSARRLRRERATGSQQERRELSPEARSAIQRRRLIAAGALAAVVAFAVLVWPIGVLTGDDDKGSQSSASGARSQRIVGQFELRPTAVSRGSNSAGAGLIVATGGDLELILQARVAPTKSREAYEVWLYNSRTDARSLGQAVTDKQGTLQGRATLPANFTRYKYIDVSREKVDDNRGHSGVSVLRERISRIQAPQRQSGTPQGQSTTPQGQTTAPQGQATTP